MVKKATKTAAKKAKKAVAKSPKADKPRRPNYQTKNVSKNIPMHGIMNVMDMLERNGQYENFKELMESRKLAVVSAPQKTINLLKKFVKDKGLHSDPLGKKIYESDEPDPFKCPI